MPPSFSFFFLLPFLGFMLCTSTSSADMPQPEKFQNSPVPSDCEKTEEHYSQPHQMERGKASINTLSFDVQMELDQVQTPSENEIMLSVPKHERANLDGNNFEETVDSVSLLETHRDVLLESTLEKDHSVKKRSVENAVEQAVNHLVNQQLESEDPDIPNTAYVNTSEPVDAAVVDSSKTDPTSDERIVVVSIENVEIDKPKEDQSSNFSSQVTIEEKEEAVKEGIEETGLPSFSEWTEKMLQAEREKNDSVKLAPSARNGNKLRLTNYASPSCGAKTLAANADAQNLGALLDSSYDDYMLNPCSSRVWFVTELCQAIQPKKIDLANFELFSSSFKEFRLLISDRYPTKDWALLGTFLALDQREVQSFDIESEHFGKYLKVEVMSYYGTEHFCPISLFRAYGTSEYEVLETDNHNEDDSTVEETLDGAHEGSEVSSNILGNAKNVVINIVKKAVETVAGTKEDNRTRPTTDLNATLPTPIAPVTPPTPIYSCDLQSTNYEFYLKQFGNIAVCRKLGYNETDDQTCDSHSVMHTLYMEALLGPNIMDCFCHYYSEGFTVSPWYSCPAKEQKMKSASRTFLEVLSGGSVETQVEQPETTDASHTRRNTHATTEAGLVGEEEPALEPSRPGANIDAIAALLAEIGVEGIDSTPIPERATNDTVNVASGPSASQKESVLVRLSNRIRTLERNMTLSVEYLEKLSKIYKRQVEDLQKTLNKTLGLLNETAHRLIAHEQRHEEDRTLLLGQIDDQRMRMHSFMEETLWTMLKILAVCLVLQTLAVLMFSNFLVRRRFWALEENSQKRLSIEKSNNELRELVVARSDYLPTVRPFPESGSTFYVPVFEYSSATNHSFLENVIPIDNLDSQCITHLSDTASNSSACSQSGSSKKRKRKNGSQKPQSV